MIIPNNNVVEVLLSILGSKTVNHKYKLLIN